jgi:molybdopterin-guanine dinucleotide biosynthesis protein A
MDIHSLNTPLTGIVMAGGKSRRMGTDKSMLEIDGVPMYLFAARLLQQFTQEIFISVNGCQASSHSYAFPFLIDQFEEEGPVGALVSCHQQLQKPLLLLACDMPAITCAFISSLVSLHKPDSGITMFCNIEEGAYEPMLSVWEVSALDDIAAFFLSGGRSFQKFLTSRNVPKYPPPAANSLVNCNTPDDWQYWKQHAV